MHRDSLITFNHSNPDTKITFNINEHGQLLITVYDKTETEIIHHTRALSKSELLILRKMLGEYIKE